jgi:hypothetical protein
MVNSRRRFSLSRSTENVSNLRKLIKEKAPHLNYVPHPNLELWMPVVDLHLDEFGAEPLHVDLDRVDTYSKLSPPFKKL